MTTIKDLKILIKDLPDTMEIRSENYFPDGNELEIDAFKIGKDRLIISFYIPEEPD